MGDNIRHFLPGRNRDNDFYLLYTGNSHYDCVIDSVFEPSHLASLLVPDYVGNPNGGDTVAHSAFVAKRRKVLYQSIIETRRGCQQPSRYEPRVAKLKVDFRRRDINATRRLLEASRPFKYYCKSPRLRGFSPLAPINLTLSDSVADGNAYSNSFDLLTKYIVCAICGYEGSRSGSILITEVGDLLEISGIAAKFDDIISSDRVKTRFDAIFKI